MATSVPVTSVPQKVRNVCFTLNNYDLSNVTFLQDFKDCSYMIFAKEVGEEGTPHLQGYVEFPNPRNTGKDWSNLKKVLGSNKFHFEKRRGTAQQASDYCEFADYPTNQVRNEWVNIYGEISRQGERTDWAHTVNAIISGSQVTDVIQDQPQLLPAIRALERLQQISIQPINREVQVNVLVGPPGSGKSRHVWDNYPNCYSKPSGQWWDGYNGEEVILLDDYYGDIEYSELLKVLDRYKYRVPIKGGFVGARWHTVFITSNQLPQYWYRETSALMRRITQVTSFP